MAEVVQILNNNVQNDHDNTITLGNESNQPIGEVGKLIILKKEGGEEGAAFEITSDITIGRDKDSDIRIKLNSISRQHARIFIDENGEYNLEHLSKTNPTIVNNATVKDSIKLQNGDIIVFGERQFLFQRNVVKPKPVKQLTSVYASPKAPSHVEHRHIPVLETIDERHTFDFGAASAAAVAGYGGSSVDRESVQQSSSSEAVYENVEKVESVLSSPIASKAVQSKTPEIEDLLSDILAVDEEAEAEEVCQSNSHHVEQNEVEIEEVNDDEHCMNIADVLAESAPVADEMEVVGAAVLEEEVQAKKTLLSTPIRNAINARRKSALNLSVSDPAVSEEVFVAAENSTPVKTVSVEVATTESQSPAVVHTASLKTPIRNAINARRKSVSTAAEVEELKFTAAGSEEMEAEVLAVVEEVSKKTLSTPMKRAINARRKSSGTAVLTVLETVNTNMHVALSTVSADGEVHSVDEPESEAVSAAPQKRSTLNTPTRNAINARRKSFSHLLATSEALVQQAVAEVADIASMDVETIATEMVEQQKESDVTPATEEEELKVRKTLLNTPTRNAIKARRLSASQLAEATVEDPVFDSVVLTTTVPVTAAIPAADDGDAVSMEVETSAAEESASVQSVATISEEPASLMRRTLLSTPLRKAINSRRKSHIEFEEKLQSVSSPLEQTVEDFAQEFETPNKSHLHTPLRLSIHNESISPFSPVAGSNVEVSKEKKTYLHTPLRLAINARLQRTPHKAEEVSEKFLSTEGIRELSKPAQRPTLKTPLKAAIQAKRKYDCMENTNSEERSSNVTDEKQQSNIKALLATPLRQAINLRRKSYAPPTLTTTATTPVKATQTAKSQVMKTPLRNAINARRIAETTSDVTVAADSMAQQQSEVKKNVLKTPIRNAINALRPKTPSATSSAAVGWNSTTSIQATTASVSSRTAMNVNLIQAINSRRKSFAPPTAAAGVIASKTPTKTPVKKSMVAEKAAVVNTMKTPLRQAIQARRPKSTVKLAVATPATAECEEVSVNTTTAENTKNTESNNTEQESQPVRRMNTPLRNLIHAQRKSLNVTTTGTADMSVEDILQPPKMDMSLRDFIHSKRKSYSNQAAVNETVVSIESAVNFIATLNKTPIKTPNRTPNMTPMKVTELDCNDTVLTTSNSKAVQSSLNKLCTPLRQAINQRRLSHDSTMDSALHSANKSASKSSAKKRRQSLEHTNVLLEDVLLATKMQISADAIANELCLQGFTPVESVEISADVVVMELESFQTDIVDQKEAAEEVDMAVEMGIIDQKESAEEVDEMSLPVSVINTPVKQLQPLSPAVATAIKQVRRRESLLNSLEKKGTTSFSTANANASTTASTAEKMSNFDEFFSNIVCHLSESEMELISQYADQLVTLVNNNTESDSNSDSDNNSDNHSESEESCEMDIDEAYAIALDTYVKGIEKCYATATEVQEQEEIVAATSEELEDVFHFPMEQKDTIKQITNPLFAKINCNLSVNNSNTPQQSNAADTAINTAINAAARCQSLDFGTTLKDLFTLPKEYTDAYDCSYDHELLELYAEELLSEGGVSTATAYNTALDTFLSDPIAFRHQIGHLALPVEITVNKAPAATKEEEVMEVEEVAATSEEVEEVAAVPEEVEVVEESCHFQEFSDYEEVETTVNPLIITASHTAAVTAASGVAAVNGQSSKRQSIDFSSTLRDIFTLPQEYTDAYDESQDEYFIELYVDELLEQGVSEQMAYGTALDTFLSDPIAFRHQIGHLSLPVEVRVNKAPAATSEELEENTTEEVLSSQDEQLIELYAVEMMEIAGLHSTIAYSVALESFLADPVQFRQKVEGQYKTPAAEEMEVEEMNITPAVKSVSAEVTVTESQSTVTPKSAVKAPIVTVRKRKTLTHAELEEMFKDLDAQMVVVDSTPVVSLSRAVTPKSSNKSVATLRSAAAAAAAVEEEMVEEVPVVDVIESLISVNATSTPKSGKKSRQSSVTPASVAKQTPPAVEEPRPVETNNGVEEEVITESLLVTETSETVIVAAMEETAVTVVEPTSALMPASVPAPVAVKKGRKTRASILATPVPTATALPVEQPAVEVIVETPTEEIAAVVTEQEEVAEPVVVVKKGRGRKSVLVAAPVAVLQEPAVEVLPTIQETEVLCEPVVVDTPAAVVEPVLVEVAAAPKKGARRKSVLTSTSLPETVVEISTPAAVVEEQPEAVVEVVKKGRKSRASILVIPTLSLIDVTPAAVVVDQAPVPAVIDLVESTHSVLVENTVKGKKTAGGRKVAFNATVEVNTITPRQIEDEEVEVETVDEVVAVAPVTKGRKRTSAATAAVEEVEVVEPVTATSNNKRAKREPIKPTTPVTAPTTAKGRGGSKRALVEVVEEVEEEEALAILCDGCDKEYFMDEIGLTEIPSGDWFCTPCSVTAKSTKANAKITKGKKNAVEVMAAVPKGGAKKRKC